MVATLVLLSLFALPAGSASAQACSLDAAEIQPLVDTYNRNVEQVPGMARGQLSGQQVDLRIATAGGERRFAVDTADDGRIVTFEETTADDPSLRVETSESAICGIITGNDPVAEFAQAYESGEIDVSGVGVVNSVKMGLVKVGVGIAKRLSSLF